MTQHTDKNWQQNGVLDFDVLLSSLGGGERRSAEYTGTKALMIAILEDGIRSYLSRTASVRAEAEFWINCRRRNFPFAFNVICDTLGLEADAVVTAIRRMREQNVSPRRAIRRSRPNVRRTGRIRLRSRRKSAAALPKKPKQLDGYGAEEHRAVAGSKEEGLVGPDIGVHPTDGESDVRLSFDPAPPDPAVGENESPDELLPPRPRAVGE